MTYLIRPTGKLFTESTRGRYCYVYLLLTNFTELELTNRQANYWWGQMHCGPYMQNFGWAMAHPGYAAATPHDCRLHVIDVKKRFLRFFNFGHVFKRFFYFLKNVGKVQSGKQINKKHFRNNSNEIDL